MTAGNQSLAHRLRQLLRKGDSELVRLIDQASRADSQSRDAVVDAICGLLREPDIVASSNAGALIDAAFSLSDHINSVQKDQVILTVIENYDKFSSIDLCAKSADYLLRAQSREPAFKSLGTLAQKPLTDGQTFGIIQAVEALYKLNRDFPEAQRECEIVLQGLRSVRILGD